MWFPQEKPDTLTWLHSHAGWRMSNIHLCTKTTCFSARLIIWFWASWQHHLYICANTRVISSMPKKDKLIIFLLKMIVHIYSPNLVHHSNKENNTNSWRDFVCSLHFNQMINHLNSIGGTRRNKGQISLHMLIAYLTPNQNILLCSSNYQTWGQITTVKSDSAY